MELYLFNTITRAKEKFIPLNQERIGMYVCGPTVYDYPHLGNALAVVIYDVLYRLLKNIYKEVVYVRNITDVDDKIINAAYDQKVSVEEVTKKITDIFHQNIENLNCLPPLYEPKATEHIQEMIAIIEKLIANDFAYIRNNHVYFRVHKYADYSKISGRKLNELVAGARVDVVEDKENPEDFVLWKPAKDIDHSFASPFGIGRPGWHIECSAMSYKYLGADFDIHGGGVDLVFPHHTNEIAQSCCAFKDSKYARYWVHNGFLTVEGEKMSKSLGNFITINELLEQGIDGEVIRYVLLSSHYRKPIDWNKKILEDAQKALDSFYRIIPSAVSNVKIPDEFLNTLLDDLNTPQSFALLHEYTRQYYIERNQEKKDEIAAKLKVCGEFIGFFKRDPKLWFTNTTIDREYIESLIEKRHLAKKEKNWKLADSIREEMKNKNIILEDLPDGETKWRRK